MFGEAESSLLQERDTILSDFFWGVCGYFSCIWHPNLDKAMKLCYLVKRRTGEHAFSVAAVTIITYYSFSRPSVIRLLII